MDVLFYELDNEEQFWDGKYLAVFIAIAELLYFEQPC